jgi:hypothetical protein
MSGGLIGEYAWFRIAEVVEEFDELLNKLNHGVGSDEFWYNFSDETIVEIYKTRNILEEAAIRLKRVDYLLACDDSEQSFHTRLREELIQAGIMKNE